MHDNKLIEQQKFRVLPILLIAFSEKLVETWASLIESVSTVDDLYV